MSRKIKYNIDVSLNENQIHIEVSGLKNPWFIRGYYLYPLKVSLTNLHITELGAAPVP